MDDGQGRRAAVPAAGDAGNARSSSFAARDVYDADGHSASPEPLWRGERYAHGRIRVAYLSADLRDHPVAALTAGMFARHDRTRFETVAISFKSDAQQ